MRQAPFTSKRWQRVEYQRLVDGGAFEGEPLELIGGQLTIAEPKGSEHSTAVDMAYVAPSRDITSTPATLTRQTRLATLRP